MYEFDVYQKLDKETGFGRGPGRLYLVQSGVMAKSAYDAVITYLRNEGIKLKPAMFNYTARRASIN